MAINVFTFVGRLGADAEVRYTQDGKAVASFNCAVDCGYGDKKTTLWVRCNLWGKQAESVSAYLKKGGQVGVTGELSERSWDDKDGQTRKSLEVRVGEIQLLGGKPEGPSEHQKQKQDGYVPPSRPDRPKPSFDDLESDLPF